MDTSRMHTSELGSGGQHSSSQLNMSTSSFSLEQRIRANRERQRETFRRQQQLLAEINASMTADDVPPSQHAALQFDHQAAVAASQSRRETQEQEQRGRAQVVATSNLVQQMDATLAQTTATAPAASLATAASSHGTRALGTSHSMTASHVTHVTSNARAHAVTSASSRHTHSAARAMGVERSTFEGRNVSGSGSGGSGGGGATLSHADVWAGTATSSAVFPSGGADGTTHAAADEAHHVHRLQQQLAHVRSLRVEAHEKGALVSQFQEQLQELGRFKQQAFQLRAQVCSLEERLLARESELARVTSELAQRSQQLVSTEQRFKQQLQLIDEAQQAEEARHKETIAAMQSELARCKADQAETAARLTDDSKLLRVKAERDGAALAEQQELVRTLREHCDHVERLAEQRGKQVRDLDDKLRAAEQRGDRAEAEVTTLRELNTSLDTAMQNARVEHERTCQRLGTAEADIDAMRSLQEQVQQAASLEGDLEVTRRELEECRAELASEKAARQVAQDNAARVSELNAEMEKELHDILRQQSAAMGSFDRVVDMRGALDAAQHDVQELRQQLKRAHSELERVSTAQADVQAAARADEAALLGYLSNVQRQLAGTTSLALTHWRIRLGVEDATDTSLDITTGAEVPTTSPVPLTVVKNAGPSVAAVGRCASDLDDAVRAAVSQRQVTDTELQALRAKQASCSSRVQELESENNELRQAKNAAEARLSATEQARSGMHEQIMQSSAAEQHLREFARRLAVRLEDAEGMAAGELRRVLRRCSNDSSTATSALINDSSYSTDDSVSTSDDASPSSVQSLTPPHHRRRQRQRQRRRRRDDHDGDDDDDDDEAPTNRRRRSSLTLPSPRSSDYSSPTRGRRRRSSSARPRRRHGRRSRGRSLGRREGARGSGGRRRVPSPRHDRDERERDRLRGRGRVRGRGDADMYVEKQEQEQEQEQERGGYGRRRRRSSVEHGRGGGGAMSGRRRGDHKDNGSDTDGFRSSSRRRRRSSSSMHRRVSHDRASAGAGAGAGTGTGTGGWETSQPVRGRRSRSRDRFAPPLRRGSTDAADGGAMMADQGEDSFSFARRRASSRTSGGGAGGAVITDPRVRDGPATPPEADMRATTSRSGSGGGGLGGGLGSSMPQTQLRLAEAVDAAIVGRSTLLRHLNRLATSLHSARAAAGKSGRRATRLAQERNSLLQRLAKLRVLGRDIEDLRHTAAVRERELSEARRAVASLEAREQQLSEAGSHTDSLLRACVLLARALGPLRRRCTELVEQKRYLYREFVARTGIEQQAVALMLAVQHDASAMLPASEDDGGEGDRSDAQHRLEHDAPTRSRPSATQAARSSGAAQPQVHTPLHPSRRRRVTSSLRSVVLGVMAANRLLATTTGPRAQKGLFLGVAVARPGTIPFTVLQPNPAVHPPVTEGGAEVGAGADGTGDAELEARVSMVGAVLPLPPWPSSSVRSPRSQRSVGGGRGGNGFAAARMDGRDADEDSPDQTGDGLLDEAKRVEQLLLHFDRCLAPWLADGGEDPAWGTSTTFLRGAKPDAAVPSRREGGAGGGRGDMPALSTMWSMVSSSTATMEWLYRGLKRFSVRRRSQGRDVSAGEGAMASVRSNVLEIVQQAHSALLQVADLQRRLDTAERESKHAEERARVTQEALDKSEARASSLRERVNKLMTQNVASVPVEKLEDARAAAAESAQLAEQRSRALAEANKSLAAHHAKIAELHKELSVAQHRTKRCEQAAQQASSRARMRAEEVTQLRQYVTNVESSLEQLQLRAQAHSQEVTTSQSQAQESKAEVMALKAELRFVEERSEEKATELARTTIELAAARQELLQFRKQQRQRARDAADVSFMSSRAPSVIGSPARPAPVASSQADGPFHPARSQPPHTTQTQTQPQFQPQPQPRSQRHVRPPTPVTATTMRANASADADADADVDVDVDVDAISPERRRLEAELSAIVLQPDAVPGAQQVPPRRSPEHRVPSRSSSTKPRKSGGALAAPQEPHGQEARPESEASIQHRVDAYMSMLEARMKARFDVPDASTSST